MNKNLQDIKDLALHAAKKTVPTEFANKTVEDVNDALREELKALCGTYNLYRRNKLDLFEIMQETMDAVAPKEVEALLSAFAEIKNYPNNVKPSFKIKKGKNRAKKFATRAAASGVYETFRLDSDTLEVNTFVIGDAAYIDFERFLSGEEDWADYMEALMAGIIHRIYTEIWECLVSAKTVETLTNYNMYEEDSGYDQENFLALVSKVANYGKPIIIAFPEFIDAMGPEVVATNVDKNEVYSQKSLEEIASIGRIRSLRGNTIIELPQSVVDERNTELAFDPSMAFILTAGNEKVVKVAFEGDTIVKDWENRDNSMEIQAYKKMGVAILSYNNWAIYKNESLKQELNIPNLDD
jgi:hypothetical protein